MARTINGNLTGRAARDERSDLRWSSVFDQFEQEIERLKADYADLLDDLRELDPGGWEVWYDDEKNVPDFKGWMNCEPAMLALRRRVAQLKGWQKEIAAMATGSRETTLAVE